MKISRIKKKQEELEIKANFAAIWAVELQSLLTQRKEHEKKKSAKIRILFTKVQMNQSRVHGGKGACQNKTLNPL